MFLTKEKFSLLIVILLFTGCQSKKTYKESDKNKKVLESVLIKEQVADRSTQVPTDSSIYKNPGLPVMDRVLDRYKRIYSPMIGSGPVMDFLGQTGLDALKGADILNIAPEKYSSTVEYGDSSISKKLRSIAQIHLAELGTRVFYCDLGSFDTHADQLATHDKLWTAASGAIRDFFDDLEEHNAADNVTMFLFSEFGRRVYDNGAGTDHGAGGVCLAIGKQVKGGEYGRYPSMKESDLDQGDLVPNLDFRGVYTTLVEDWMKLDPVPIVGGQFEKPTFI